MIDFTVFLPLLTLGLVSGAHCIGMCGGIMGALGMAIPAQATGQRWLILVAYNIGRISSYVFMGAIAGLFAKQFAAAGGGIVLRVAAGILLIVMGLYLADWWRGLTKLETVGRYLWVYIQPLGKRIMPVDNMVKGLMLGALWGWLPCGLVYAALAMAMTQPSSSLAAGAMLAFGLGTLPAVLGAGFAAQHLTRILQQRQIRIGLALLVIGFGVWTIVGIWVHGQGHQHHSHDRPIETHDHASMGHTNHEQAPIDHHNSHPEVTNMDDVKTPSSARNLERQRTDSPLNLDDHKESLSSSAGQHSPGAHHHESPHP